MPIGTTRAFVMGSSTFGEQDRLIHLLTRDQGIIRAVAPGSMKARNRFGSLFELFTEGEFQYYWQENRDLITISRGDILHSYFSTVSDPKNIFYFFLIADVFFKFIPFNHKEKRLYRLLNAVLEQREAGVAMDLLLLYFLVWVLRIEGMMFNPGMCSNCGSVKLLQAWFRTDFRGVLCAACKSDEIRILTAGDLQFLQWSNKGAPKDLNQWQGKIDIARLIRNFTHMIQYHGECSLKSAQYLSEFL